MTIVQKHPPAHVTHAYTRWAWITLAFTPVLVAGGILISLAASGAGPGLGGVLVGLLSLAAPTTALILGIAGSRAKESAAHTVLTTALLVFAACAVLLPIAVISVNASLIAVAASVVVLAFASWRLARSS